MSKLKNTYGFSNDVLKTILDIHVNEASLSPKQKEIAKLAGNPKKIDAEDLAKLRTKHKHHHKKPVQEARTALDKTYPHGANDMATLAIQIRALLNFLSKSGVLKKAMREHTELVEAYIGQEVDERNIKDMNYFLTGIIEELQQVKTDRSNPDLKITCGECGKSKPASLMLADISKKPGTYVCKSCADDKEK